jgi:hypothetical protein
MIQHALDQRDGILIVTPRGPLAASDFEALRAEVTPSSSVPASCVAS